MTDIYTVKLTTYQLQVIRRLVDERIEALLVVDNTVDADDFNGLSTTLNYATKD